jgi:hypothetical protein
MRRRDAERFIEEVRGDDPDLASYLRIEERELEGAGLNEAKGAEHRCPAPGRGYKPALTNR